VPLTDLHIFLLYGIHSLLESNSSTEAHLGFGFPHGTPQCGHRPTSQVQIIKAKQVFRELTPRIIRLAQPWHGMPPSIGVQLLLRDEWLLQKCPLGWSYRSPGLKQLILAVRVNIGLLLA
jgi:hypothetical protein